jgi:hypothetical protein
MHRLACVLCLSLAAVAALSANAPAQSSSKKSAPRREVLNNDAVINLVRAGFKEKTVISIILSSPVAFDVSTPRLIELKKRGVSERIVLVMMQRQEMFNQGAALSDLSEQNLFRPEDEDFFNSPPRVRMPGDERRGSDSDETSIFGSRSGSESRTRSRGGISGESEHEGEVSGSATVRIIRPPSEGGSGPKLERARKLDNQAVIDMVQANFSEGTVLRRIENTHVEFDLSPAGLAELRRNRVSERVIKAMETAMGDEQPDKK